LRIPDSLVRANGSLRVEKALPRIERAARLFVKII